MLLELIYGLFFVLALASALMVVFSPHAVYSALYLVLTMVAIAALFILMNAQLAAMFQVIVYAGAIMVLFLFVIMLLNVGRAGPAPPRGGGLRWAGLALALAFAVQLAALIGRFAVAGGYTLEGAASVTIQTVAARLITDYIYAFAITSVLLLIAVIGSVVLARKRSDH